MLQRAKKILLLLCFTICFGYGQNVNFINPFAVPQTINYGFVGALKGTSFGMVSKLQWPGSVMRSLTNLAFADFFLENANIGLGIQLVNDTQMKTGYSFNNATTIYTYPLQISESWTLRPALYVAFSRMSFNQKKTIFGDQIIDIEAGIINPTSIDPLATKQINRQSFFDFGGSILANNDFLWFGVSVKHINTPNISLISEKKIKLPIFVAAHGAVIIDLPRFFYGFNPNKKNRILLMGNFSKEQKSSKLDVNIQYLYGDFGMGLGLSMMPLRNIESQDKFNYLLLNTSYQFADFKINFAYAYEMRSIINSQGIFELSFLYNIKSERRMSATPKIF